jgi:hypothetical protein
MLTRDKMGSIIHDYVDEDGKIVEKFMYNGSHLYMIPEVLKML